MEFARDKLDEAAIEGVVDAQIRPLLNVHGGDIDVVSVSERGDVELEFQGSCRACPLKHVTYAIAVRERLRQLPGVRGVTVRGASLSDAALDRVARSYAGYSLMFRTPSVRADPAPGSARDGRPTDP
jgi:Fe-S cluster biogenesis protein NfuA